MEERQKETNRVNVAREKGREQEKGSGREEKAGEKSEMHE